MQVFQPAELKAHPIEAFGSSGASAARLASGTGPWNMVQVRLEPGGILGLHPTVGDQHFVLVRGSGQVRGKDPTPVRVAACQAVLWEAGEEHETNAGPEGLVAVAIESELIRGDW
jgi:quercetin dioxygenase-like cupin family protein